MHFNRKVIAAKLDYIKQTDNPDEYLRIFQEIINIIDAELFENKVFRKYFEETLLLKLVKIYKFLKQRNYT